MKKIEKKIIFNILWLLVCGIPFAYAVQSVQLPDGTSVTIRAGESPQMAYTRAMNMYPEAFGNVRVPKQKIMDLDWYNECKLKASTSSASIHAAVQACEYKAVPKKCRVHNVDKDALGNEKADLRIQCVEECNKANYYSKTLGECSRG
jgi:hypothetical protein